MSIGSNLIAARKAKGFTQEQLAERLGVSFQAVRRLGKGCVFAGGGKACGACFSAEYIGQTFCCAGNGAIGSWKTLTLTRIICIPG